MVDNGQQLVSPLHIVLSLGLIVAHLKPTSLVIGPRQAYQPSYTRLQL